MEGVNLRPAHCQSHLGGELMMGSTKTGGTNGEKEREK